ncbi:hypothetical protein Lser_V15G30429 [Lactuca serriola]
MKNQRNVFPSRKSKSNRCPPVATKKAMPTDIEDEIWDEKNPPPLNEDGIALLKTYGLGPYSTSIKKAEKDVKEMAKRINDLCDDSMDDIGEIPILLEWNHVFQFYWNGIMNSNSVGITEVDA